MPRFVWHGGNEIPTGVDLRLRGWRLVRPVDVAGGGPARLGEVLVLVEGQHRASLAWRTPEPTTQRLRERRRWVLMFGIANPQERAALLRSGLGDVIGEDFTLDELAVRARRVRTTAKMLPRARSHGPLQLDLLARDGYVDGKRLGLHPREFALVWRLMEEPGRPVDKATLLRDVWQLDYTPETNSLAVHARRLRAKLEIAGLRGLVRTTIGGGYALAAESPTAAAESVRPAFLLDPRAAPARAPEPAASEETLPPAMWRN